jgi:hypothetical protein
MSLSATHRRQENNPRRPNPSSHDLLNSNTDRNTDKEHTSGTKDDSLVEHILDFLDKYPVRFTPRTPLTRCLRAY